MQCHSVYKLSNITYYCDAIPNLLDNSSSILSSSGNIGMSSMLGEYVGYCKLISYNRAEAHQITKGT